MTDDIGFVQHFKLSEVHLISHLHYKVSPHVLLSLSLTCSHL